MCVCGGGPRPAQLTLCVPAAVAPDAPPPLRRLRRAAAQVAAQEGGYVARLLQKNAFDARVGTLALRPKQKPFR